MVLDSSSFGFGALFAGILILALLILVALYVYFALAWLAISRRMKHPKPWLSWIPFANLAMILQLGGFHWAWIFLIFLSWIPVVGSLPLLVLLVIAHWRIFGKLNYPSWLSLALVIGAIPGIGFLGTIAYLIIVGIVAWSKKEKSTPVKRRK